MRVGLDNIKKRFYTGCSLNSYQNILILFFGNMKKDHLKNIRVKNRFFIEIIFKKNAEIDLRHEVYNFYKYSYINIVYNRKLPQKNKIEIPKKYLNKIIVNILLRTKKYNSKFLEYCFKKSFLKKKK
jgi:hypothetical protein